MLNNGDAILKQTHTHTHIYIYRERERERERVQTKKLALSTLVLKMDNLGKVPKKYDTI